MDEKIEDLSVSDIERGYHFCQEMNCYACNFCGRQFDVDEIYQMNNHFYTCRRAIEIHIKEEHGSVFDAMLLLDNQYCSFTEKQEQLLSLIHQNLTDSEIAKKTGVSQSTVRHQKFMFREKAKQAKMNLAIYHLAFLTQQDKESIMDIPKSAKMVDDRFMVTIEEEEQVRNEFFDSFSPLLLSEYPTKEKKKIIVLKRIAAEFKEGIEYSEKETDGILKSIYSRDYVTLRRALIEYGFLERTKDCNKYWKG